MNGAYFKKINYNIRVLFRIFTVVFFLFAAMGLAVGIIISRASVATAGGSENNHVIAPAALKTVEPPAKEIRQDIKVSLSEKIEKSGRYVVKTVNGDEAVLTLDLRLQKRAEDFLKSNRVAFGAVVAVEPATGRVLAYAEHSEYDPSHNIFSISKPYLAASLFKIITAEAVLTEKKIPIDETLCYHGGTHKLTDKLLKENPRTDRRCQTFEQALGHSTNVIFARLAHKNLTPFQLNEHARSFLFGEPIPFEVAVENSVAVIPQDLEEMAKTAAGFGEVKITPLHASMIAAAVANEGVMMRPFIVESLVKADGTNVPSPGGSAIATVTSAGVADLLSQMMYTTTTEGTGRKAFRVKRGKLDFKNDIPIAGKTGSLSDKGVYRREYTWYSGFGPVDAPEIAVAALVVNHISWRTKGSYVAREIFEEYFKNKRTLAAAATSRKKIR